MPFYKVPRGKMMKRVRLQEGEAIALVDGAPKCGEYVEAVRRVHFKVIAQERKRLQRERAEEMRRVAAQLNAQIAKTQDG